MEGLGTALEGQVKKRKLSTADNDADADAKTSSDTTASASATADTDAAMLDAAAVDDQQPPGKKVSI